MSDEDNVTEMSQADSAWLRWTFIYPSPDTDPSLQTAFSDGYVSGMARAIAIIDDKFFGGPTRDMILGWLYKELPEHSWSEYDKH